MHTHYALGGKLMQIGRFMILMLTGCSSSGLRSPEPGYVRFVSESYVDETSNRVSDNTAYAHLAPASTSTRLGNCTLTYYPKLTYAGCAPEKFPDAGVITLNGGLRSLSLSPQACDNDYQEVSSAQLLWQGGETLTVSAAGGSVPQWTTTLPAPFEPTVTAPSPANLVLHQSKPFTLNWTGAGQGEIVAQIEVTPSDGSVRILDCRFNIGDGAGTIPSSVLSMLPAGSGAGVDLSTVSTSGVTVGDRLINVEAVSPGVIVGGARFGSAVAFVN